MKSILAAILLLLLASVATAKVVYVPDNYPTIQQAINNASKGDTIVVRDGIYVENVVVNVESLTIKSENGSANCILQAAYKRKPVFDVNADHVNISGFTIKGADKGINLNANRCSITNNNVSNNYYGIYLYSSNNSTLANNRMFNNTYNLEIWRGYYNNIDKTNTVNGKPVYYLVNQEDIQIPSDAGYVGLINCQNISVRDLILANNGQGVLLVHTKNSRIENVTVLGDWSGIYFYSSSNNVLVNNTIVSNTFGVWLDCSNNNTIANNTVTNNDYGMYFSYSNNNTLTNNNISLNTWLGVYFSYSINNMLLNNSIWGNWAGNYVSSSNDNTLYFNNLVESSHSTTPYKSNLKNYFNYCRFLMKMW